MSRTLSPAGTIAWQKLIASELLYIALCWVIQLTKSQVAGHRCDHSWWPNSLLCPLVHNTMCVLWDVVLLYLLFFLEVL